MALYTKIPKNNWVVESPIYHCSIEVLLRIGSIEEKSEPPSIQV